MKRIRHLLFFLSAAGLVLIQGCAFTPQIAEVDEIATETGDLIAEIEYGMKFDDVILLVRYVDDERIPSVFEWQDSWLELITALRGGADTQHTQSGTWVNRYA